MTTQPLFSVGGLATGMDTQSIIDKMVQLESQPLTDLQQRQSAFSSQVSLLGDLSSKLGDLQAAASALASGGVLANQATSSNSSFSAVPGAGATPGAYQVQVNTLATAAKWRSGPFGSSDAVQAGTLTLTVAGNTYPPPDPTTGVVTPITITAGESLAQIASDIRASGAPVSATVLNDGTSDYLSITNLATGYGASGPSSALQVAFTPTDPSGPGTALDASAYQQAATNASFAIDGLTFSRTSNTVTDALPGTTLTLESMGGPAETLTIGTDVSGTQANLQKFVDAYNTVMSAVQKQLAVTQGTDRSTTLAGDPTVLGLEQALESLGSSIVGGLGTVRSLADLGVKTQQDGTLTIDQTVLASAVARDPVAVNTIFADASTGMSKLTSDLADLYTTPVTGLLSLRQDGLQEQISSITDQEATLQARITAYQDNLTAQFTAMENVVGQLKTIGDFLTSQENAASSSSK